MASKGELLCSVLPKEKAKVIQDKSAAAKEDWKNFITTLHQKKSALEVLNYSQWGKTGSKFPLCLCFKQQSLDFIYRCECLLCDRTKKWMFSGSLMFLLAFYFCFLLLSVWPDFTLSGVFHAEGCCSESKTAVPDVHQSPQMYWVTKTHFLFEKLF